MMVGEKPEEKGNFLEFTGFYFPWIFILILQYILCTCFRPANMIKRWRPGLKCSHGYAKRGVQSAALSYLKHEPSFNKIISSLCKQKLFKDAIRAFGDIEKNAECQLELSTYANLFSACSSLRSLEYGRKIHNHVLKSNLLPNMILENHIINMYGKCGSVKDAKRAFNNMRERNVVAWTALIAGYSQNGLDIDAIKLYVQMQQCGLMPDHFTFGSVVKACASLMQAELGVQLHAQVIKSEFGNHGIAQNALVSMYTKFGRIIEARDVFSRIKWKDLISWSSMIAGFSKLGYELEALCCFKEMLSHGAYYPNEFTLSSVFTACGSLDQPEYGRQIHGISIKHGFQGDVYAGCSLTNMYAKCGFLHLAVTAFDQIENPDIAAWNATISGFANSGHANEAMLIFSQMRLSGSAPDDISVRSLLGGFINPYALAQGKQVHCYVIKFGLDSNLPVCNTLLTMYANCSDYVAAYKMFNNIKENADLVSWNAIITMCMHQHWITEVFSLFRNMLLFHIAPDHITLAGVLGACGEAASLELGNKIHCCAIKYGLGSDVMVMNGLVDMYVKCGSLEMGRKLFDSMQNLDVFSWTSLIVGYAQFGDGEEAVNLFRLMMDKGIKPNQVTFVGVLTACSHVGLIEEGMHLFKSMEREHGIIPTREHFSCVVDLLGRAGRIHEAEALIHQMGFETDIVIWKTLLAACKNRSNIEIGKRVAENILKLDPSNSAAHVLLCSIHASAGDWKDVATLRTLMREKGVKKVAGSSWIEIKDGIHFFSAQDGLHPERDRVFVMLEELWLQILDAGYDPSLE